MKNSLISVIVVMVFTLFFSGCGNYKQDSENESKGKSKYNLENYIYPGKENRNEVVFCCGNYDLSIYEAYSSYRALAINIFSYKELDIENVGVSIDIKTPYKVFMDKNEYEEDEHNQMIKQVLEVCNKNITPDEIKALDISEFPKINNYVLMINFDMTNTNIEGGEEQFRSMKVTIDNKEYEVNVGKVKLLYEEKEELKDYDEGKSVSGQTGGAFEFPIDPSILKKNTFEYSGFMFETINDIEIIDIGILEGSTLKMKDIVLQISGDVNMDIEYEEGKTIKVKKGSSINAFIKISDEKLNDSLTYHSSAIIYVKYKYDNKEYTIINTPIFKTNYYPYEVYAQIVDGIDVVGYYNTMAD